LITVLPAHELTDAFVDLITIYPPQDSCTAIGDYIFDNYIEGLFPEAILNPYKQ
jgi:hypothetical protein